MESSAVEEVRVTRKAKSAQPRATNMALGRTSNEPDLNKTTDKPRTILTFSALTMTLLLVCKSALVDPHMVDTGNQPPVISLSNRNIAVSASIPFRGGDLSTGELDEPLKEENSEYVEGIKMMKRMETTK